MTSFPYSQYVQAAQAYEAASAIGGFPVGARQPHPALAAAYAALWLRPGAPLPVVKAAYRSLAARHHPDAGGDDRAMRRLNDAYDTISRAFAA